MSKESKSVEVFFWFVVLFVGILVGSGLYSIFIEPYNLDARFLEGYGVGWDKGEAKGYVDGKAILSNECFEDRLDLDICREMHEVCQNQLFKLENNWTDDVLHWKNTYEKRYAEKLQTCEADLNECRQEIGYSECNLTVLNGQHCINSNLLRCSELGGD